MAAVAELMTQKERGKLLITKMDLSGIIANVQALVIEPTANLQMIINQTLPVLADHYCPYYTSWDQHVRDTTRVGQWKRDFDSLVSVNALPRLNTLRIINDHTEGLAKGRPTPFAHTADNDLAVGMFIDYLSKSPVWKESLVVILEDDAQDGPDHVDAHRSTAYLAGPYVKRHFVDHTPYTTTGILRTIELILGLPPMSQYDAAATPLWRSFTDTTGHKCFQPCSGTVRHYGKKYGH